MNEIKCLECKSTNFLIKLQNGKYACKKCLDKLGEEQNKIKNDIQDYLSDNYEIINPINQVKTLQAVLVSIMKENDLLSEELTELIAVTAERMFGNEYNS